MSDAALVLIVNRELLPQNGLLAGRDPNSWDCEGRTATVRRRPTQCVERNRACTGEQNDTCRDLDIGEQDNEPAVAARRAE